MDRRKLARVLGRPPKRIHTVQHKHSCPRRTSRWSLPETAFKLDGFVGKTLVDPGGQIMLSRLQALTNSTSFTRRNLLIRSDLHGREKFFTAGSILSSSSMVVGVISF